MAEDTLEIVSSSPEETGRIGERIGRVLKGGEVLALFGELGSGKTCLIQGIGSGLELSSSRHINSPTFVIINEYEGRLPLFHFDLYRIRNWREVYDLGWNDYLERGGVIAVEWAEKMGPLLPRDHIRVELKITGEDSRRIAVAGRGAGGIIEDLSRIAAPIRGLSKTR